MTTITFTKYGSYAHGKPSYAGHGSYRRTDTWTPNGQASCQDVSTDTLACASLEDDSPIWVRYPYGYNPACACCWLNHGHTTAYHNAAIAPRGEAL